MVEVLVSVVILSFGLLGMVGMQAASLRANQEARYQSIAVNLARELADLLRSNKEIAILPAASNPYLGAFSSPLTPIVPVYCMSVGVTACSNANDVPNQTIIANAQMTEWLPRVDNVLPSARVVVCFDATPYDANGLPKWACTNSGSTIVIKMGWTKGNTNRTVDPNNPLLVKANDATAVPSVIVPVTAGAST